MRAALLPTSDQCFSVYFRARSHGKETPRFGALKELNESRKEALQKSRIPSAAQNSRPLSARGDAKDENGFHDDVFISLKGCIQKLKDVWGKEVPTRCTLFFLFHSVLVYMYHST